MHVLQPPLPRWQVSFFSSSSSDWRHSGCLTCQIQKASSILNCKDCHDYSTLGTRGAEALSRVCTCWYQSWPLPWHWRPFTIGLYLSGPFFTFSPFYPTFWPRFTQLPCMSHTTFLYIWPTSLNKPFAHPLPCFCSCFFLPPALPSPLKH